MRAPYGLNILDNCLTCPMREDHLFCNLPPAAVQRLNEIRSSATYPKSAMLFIEGQLNATISNRPYEVTAEMVEPGQANFIARDAFLHFLRENGEVAVRVAEQLSRNYYTAYEEIKTLGLTSSPSEKFAKLLLSWSPDAKGTDLGAAVRMTLTHEEIAEMIGTTRETVSRLFSDFKKKQLLQVKGATLTIHNRAALEKIINS
jgi:CRP/FNR family cyclic AMP-dependent transcriptional regulator